jgi:SAM-dependent MidA family methyltransferase
MHLKTYTTQRQWLLDLGINEELERLRASEFAIIDKDRASDRGQAALFQWYNLRQRVQALTDPHGMGKFKVLLMYR